MDWQTLATPIILAVVPILVLFIKKVIPETMSWIYPIIATALGAVLDTLQQYATSQPLTPGKGALLGLAAVGVREVVDQLRKMKTGPQ